MELCFSFAEMPDCRYTIASTPDVIANMIAAMLCLTYTYDCCRSGMCALLCLSFSRETHRFLDDNTTLERILRISKKGGPIMDAFTGAIDHDKLATQTLVRCGSLKLYKTTFSSCWGGCAFRSYFSIDFLA